MYEASPLARFQNEHGRFVHMTSIDPYVYKGMTVGEVRGIVPDGHEFKMKDKSAAVYLHDGQVLFAEEECLVDPAIHRILLFVLFG